MDPQKKIAIVDDHTSFRKGLCLLIDLFPDHKVILDTDNGLDFIRRLDPRMPPDILLLDIAMPEMDGYAVATWVTRHHPSIKVLALSTLDSEVAIIRMIRAGARGYLHKDAEPAELKAAFHEILTLGYYYNDAIRQTLSTVGLQARSQEAATLIATLNERELTFLRLVCSEKTYYDIADEMYLSVRTIDGYRDALFKKLQVSTRIGLVLFAVKNGIVHP
jgi:DNA-binding NarL/FixJ family response regulator